MNGPVRQIVAFIYTASRPSRVIPSPACPLRPRARSESAASLALACPLILHHHVRTFRCIVFWAATCQQRSLAKHSRSLFRPKKKAESAAITPSGRLAPATVGHGECGLLVGLQSELLGQHDIPKRKVPYRTEAPDGNLGLARTDLVDIHIPAAVNTIALGRVGAPHFKKSVFV